MQCLVMMQKIVGDYFIESRHIMCLFYSSSGLFVYPMKF